MMEDSQIPTDGIPQRHANQFEQVSNRIQTRHAEEKCTSRNSDHSGFQLMMEYKLTAVIDNEQMQTHQFDSVST
jgi:hypothetical protein